MHTTGNTREAIEFLRRWSPDDLWVLTSIYGDVEKVTETRTFTPEGWENAASWIDTKQGISNVYFHPNPAMGTLRRKATKNDIRALGCLHVDIDPRNGEELHAERERITGLLARFTPPPSVVLDSGNGFQAFWLLEPEPQLVVNGDITRIEVLERYSRQLELLLGGDNCFNIDRLMRLPGTINVPDAKKRAKGRVPAPAGLVSASWTRYKLREFTPAVPTAAAGVSDSHRAVVNVSGNIADVSVEELQSWASSNGKSISDSTLAIIATGDDPVAPRFSSRSEALFRVCCDLVRAEVPDEMIMGVITGGNAIAESVKDKRGWRAYAIRQIERAKEEAVEPWVRRLNDKHAVVTNLAGKCRVITETTDDLLQRNTIQVQSFEDIRNAYCNQPVQVGENAKGQPKYTGAGSFWLTHAMRRTYENLVFAPGENKRGAYNLWKGFGCDALPGNNHELFLDHVLHNLCEGREEFFNYLIGWVARMIQKPAAQGETAVVFRGKQGTGKSFFAKTIGSLLGAHYLPVADSRHLVGNFNGHLRDCLFLFADEAFFAGDKRHEGVIKTLITEPTIVVERKGVDAELSPNYVHLMMASNDSWVVPAALDDRRFFVLEVSDKRRRDSRYFATIQDSLEKGGRENLLHYFMNYDLGNFDVRKVPQTEALAEQKAWSMEPHYAFWFDRLQDGFLLRSHGNWSDTVAKDELFQEYLMEVTQMRRGHPLNPVTFGKFLHRVCPEPWLREVRETRVIQDTDQYGQETGRVIRKQVRLWRIPDLSQARELWEKEFGEVKWKPVCPEEAPEVIIERNGELPPL